jgi:hypothetical protein
MYTLEQTVAAVLALNSNSKIINANWAKVGGFIENHADQLDLVAAESAITTVIYSFELDILRGRKLSNFKQSLYKALTSTEEFDFYRLCGLLATMPSILEQINKNNTLAELAASSEFVGEVGKKITVDLKILDCRTIQWSDGFFNLATAIDRDQNIYTFTPKILLGSTTDYTYSVTAKVKAHHVDTYIYNANVTKLFYVKAAK